MIVHTPNAPASPRPHQREAGLCSHALPVTSRQYVPAEFIVELPPCEAAEAAATYSVLGTAWAAPEVVEPVQTIQTNPHFIHTLDHAFTRRISDKTRSF